MQEWLIINSHECYKSSKQLSIFNVQQWNFLSCVLLPTCVRLVPTKSIQRTVCVFTFEFINNHFCKLMHLTLNQVHLERQNISNSPSPHNSRNIHMKWNHVLFVLVKHVHDLSQSSQFSHFHEIVLLKIIPKPRTSLPIDSSKHNISNNYSELKYEMFDFRSCIWYSNESRPWRACIQLHHTST